MRSTRVVLAQIKPRKGDVAWNAGAARKALDPEADLVVFPETVLSGYFVEGGAREVALTREGLARALGEPPPGCDCDVALGFYEKDDWGVYNSAAYLTPRGARYHVVHVHRKVFLPTYGLFDEARFVEPGREVRAFDTRFGRMGLLVCEDLWHSLPATVLALDGAGLILCAAASPARGFAPRPDASTARPRNLDEWDRTAARTAREHGVFVMVSQLAGSEGGKLLSGGSTAWGPGGELLARGPLFAEGAAGALVRPCEIGRIRARQPFLADLRAALPHLRRSLDLATEARDGTEASGAPVVRNVAPAPESPGTESGFEPQAPSDGDGSLSRRLESALVVDLALVETALLAFIQDEVARRRGFSRVVVGVSGGVDSAVVLLLACRALGADNVFGFRLPDAASSADGLANAALVLEAAGVRARTLAVAGVVDGYLAACEADASGLRRGNFAARVRAAVLFDQSAKLTALPLGTGNKSERLLGYFTWHADDAPPVNPLGDLFKTQVTALARHLGVPNEIVSSPPSADLVPGVHDEDELGISYRRADPILLGLVRGHAPRALVAGGFSVEDVEVVRRRLAGTHWKRRPPASAVLSGSSTESYLRPLDY